MSKYNAIKTERDGIKFDSKKEAKRYKELKHLEKGGIIKNLSLQPKFLLQEKFEYRGEHFRAIYYIADFMYYDPERQAVVVEDVKGIKTEVYKLKKKLFIKKYPDYVFCEV